MTEADLNARMTLLEETIADAKAALPYAERDYWDEKREIERMEQELRALKRQSQQ